MLFRSETSVLSEDEEAGQDGNLIFRITPYGLSYNHRRGLNYTQGLRLNSREDDWSALFIGNQLDTVEGRYDKAVIVARPPSVDYCVITGQGNENNDGERVRINRNGELYERGSRVYSNNNRPEIVTRASNDISPQGLDPGLHRMGFLSYSTTSSTGIQIKLPSAGSYYWIVHVSNPFYNGDNTEKSYCSSGISSGGTVVATISGNGKRTCCSLIFYRYA